MKKKFDIEKAKQGAKVITRDGRPAEILKYNYTSSGSQRIVVCSKDENDDDTVYIVNLDGSWISGMEHNADIFLEAEPIYHPYTSAAEMDAAIKKHGLIVKNASGRKVIRGYDDEDVFVDEGCCTYVGLFACYTWLDGTPCGVLEEDRS